MAGQWGGAWGTDPGGLLCTPEPLEYLDTAVIGCWVGSCLISWLAVSLQKGGGRFLPHLCLEVGWSGWTTSCLPHGGVGGACQPPAAV